MFIVKPCCTEAYEDGLAEGGKRTFISLAKSIDNLLDKISDYKELLQECFKYLSQEEVDSPNIERLALLEKIRLKIKRKNGESNGKKS